MGFSTQKVSTMSYDNADLFLGENYARPDFEYDPMSEKSYQEQAGAANAKPDQTWTSRAGKFLSKTGTTMKETLLPVAKGTSTAVRNSAGAVQTGLGAAFGNLQNLARSVVAQATGERNSLPRPESDASTYGVSTSPSGSDSSVTPLMEIVVVPRNQ